MAHNTKQIQVKKTELLLKDFESLYESNDNDKIEKENNKRYAIMDRYLFRGLKNISPSATGRFRNTYKIN